MPGSRPAGNPGQRLERRLKKSSTSLATPLLDQPGQDAREALFDPKRIGIGLAAELRQHFFPENRDVEVAHVIHLPLLSRRVKDKKQSTRDTKNTEKFGASTNFSVGPADQPARKSRLPISTPFARRMS